MSKINDLIKEMCPNGVECKTIGEICYFQNGYAFKSSLFKSKGDILLRITNIDGKKIDLSDVKYIDVFDYNIDLSPFKVGSDEIVIAMSGATTGKIGINRTGKLLYLNQRVGKITPRDDRMNNHFLYHYLLNKVNYFYQLAGGGAQPNLSSDAIKNTIIPIPPIEVQEEIVRILDKFGELEAELEAELEVRKSQYEFWRGKIINMYDSKNIKLSDMAKIYDGTHSTPNYQENGIPFISVENISNIYGTNKFISKEDYKKYKIKPEINDVFMTRIGTIGKCSVFEKQINLAYYVSLALIRPNTEIILPKYLKYVIESNIGKDELYKRTLVHAVPIKVNKDEIGKIVLPVPSIDDQKKIISKLDKFESLTESISSGLPAEIELRRQQYEYYRNKLLNFEVV